MLFNSLEFIFFFLPVTLGLFFLIGLVNVRLAVLWIVLSSLFFYGWWNPGHVCLLLTSMIFNYGVGIGIVRTAVREESGRRAGWLLAGGITANLLLLGYFKYTPFLAEILQSFFNFSWRPAPVKLPLGISFFTFTQVAFLIDVFRKRDRSTYRLLDYGWFVTYFPHLIAGPIYYHSEMIPQMQNREVYRFRPENVAAGISIFSLGLFKKAVLADPLAAIARPAFEAAAQGQAPGVVETWTAALAYTCQLYFDFSGYVDMAVGLSLMFNIRLPLNFNSPYQAVNMIEFWRRWHMTLGRFFRDYLYIPLGGSRRGRVRQYANLMMTMLLCGLWHGAGWTFVLWGGLHGLFLVINRVWQRLRTATGMKRPSSCRYGRFLSRLLTFVAVVVAWAIFRADNLSAAVVLLKGLAGVNGVALPVAWSAALGSLGAFFAHCGIAFRGNFGGLWPDTSAMLRVAALLAILWMAPNTSEIMARCRPVLNMAVDGRAGFRTAWFQWRLNGIFALVSALLALSAVLSIVLVDEVLEFVYFKF